MHSALSHLRQCVFSYLADGENRQLVAEARQERFRARRPCATSGWRGLRLLVTVSPCGCQGNAFQSTTSRATPARSSLVPDHIGASRSRMGFLARYGARERRRITRDEVALCKFHLGAEGDAGEAAATMARRLAQQQRASAHAPRGRRAMFSRRRRADLRRGAASRSSCLATD